MNKQAGIAEIIVLVAIVVVATFINNARLQHQSDQQDQALTAAKVDRLEREITELKAGQKDEQ